MQFNPADARDYESCTRAGGDNRLLARCANKGDNLNFKSTSPAPRITLARSADELLFAFSVLLTQPLSRPEAAARFEVLWNEANDAAQSCADSDAVLRYVALLQKMDHRWRFLRSMN